MPRLLLTLVLQLLYISNAFVRIAGVLYLAAVAALTLPLLSILNTTDTPRSVVSALPVPGTYEASLKARIPPAQAAAAPAAAATVASIASSAAVWPIHGPVTTEFGASGWPYQRSHTGIDITSRLPLGTAKVVAYRAGQVFRPGGQFGGYGNLVAIDHGGGLTSYYGHLLSTSAQPGQMVNAGDIIGIEGSTGHSTGPHVHFEIRLNNVPVNPRNYMTGNP